MKVLKFNNFSIILDNVQYIEKRYKKAEPYVGIPEHFFLCFEMISGKEHEIVYNSKEERDKDYDRAIFVLQEDV